MKRIILIAGAVCCMIFQSASIYSQISHGGSPVTNDEDYHASKVLYLLEPADPEYIQGLKSARYNRVTKALNYAIERPVDISPDMNGEWIEKGDFRVWRAHLISPDAYSVGILFSEFELKKDVRVFLYDPQKHFIKGSFTSENNNPSTSFFVGHIPGEEVIIELQVPKSISDYGKLRVGLLSHAFLPVFNEKSAEDTGLGTSQACEIDVNCSEGEDWQIIKRAVCQISTPSLLCSGVLINNTSYNGAPYILTAEHCINKSFFAESSVYYFGFENSECGLEDAPRDQSVSGSTLLATGDSLDFTLVRLTRKPPREYNVYYAGWDVREKDHQQPVAIHHPNADAKKISIDFNSTSSTLSVPGDLTDYLLESCYRIQEWDIGTTEGGSSGCPLFNSSKRVIGVLSGGQAMCGDSIGYDEQNKKVIYSLDDNRNDYFSKLYFDWDHYPAGNKQLKKWLDPVNSGQLAIGGLAFNSVDVPASVSADKKLHIYPNPSNGNLTISLTQNSGKDVTVKMYELSGRLIFTHETVSVFPLHISLPDLPAGIYMILVKDADQVSSGRVIIQ